MPQTQTKHRLTLRPFTEGDAPMVAALIGELDVSRWLTRVPYPYAVSDAESFIARNQDKRFVRAVDLEGQFIGCVSIEDELGYWYGKPYWGQGIASEAATTLVAEYFETTTDPVLSGHILGNHASRRVLEKLGFVDQPIEAIPSAALNQPVEVQKMILSHAHWDQRP